ncbi:hypothetical protein Tco_1070990 [Tanacetum coccineum]|uniref:Reverse transcriptase domain-containing protein n=1 Tax=Tanacetum coccineum TaxID=301880 RepID=A0ABQ5HQ57_9ASTR
MIQYLEKVRTLIDGFKALSVEQVLRSENKKAVVLSKIASTCFAHLTKKVMVKILKENSICEKEILVVVEEEGYTWMTPLFDYLTKGTLPTKAKKARAVKIMSRQYAVIGGVLYRNSFLELWLRCVGPLQENYVISKSMYGTQEPSTTAYLNHFPYGLSIIEALTSRVHSQKLKEK